MVKYILMNFLSLALTCCLYFCWFFLHITNRWPVWETTNRDVNLDNAIKLLFNGGILWKFQFYTESDLSVTQEVGNNDEEILKRFINLLLTLYTTIK